MLLERVRHYSKARGDQPAVVYGEQILTYHGLQNRIEQVAYGLQRSGICRGAVVALYMQRDADVVAAMLGVMASGAAYTVVESQGNIEEEHARLSTIQPHCVLHDGSFDGARVPHVYACHLNALAECVAPVSIEPPIQSTEVAYVLFTSGSTGKPKGVAVTHGNIAHYTESIRNLLGITQPLTYGHVSSFAADLGNTSVFLSLATGGSLHLVSSDLRKDPLGLVAYLDRNCIDFLKITPTHWSVIFNAYRQSRGYRLSLEHLVLGGEALPRQLALETLESGVTKVLSNHYGPTETTVGVAVLPMRSMTDLEAYEQDAIPIGYALGNTDLVVRTTSGTLLRTNAVGELLIGGPSVSNGYINDPTGTEKAFLDVSLTDKCPGKYYATGDLVSVDTKGVVTFLGRVDRQVKVNGYRVEPEHIEVVLRQVESVSEGAIIPVNYRGKTRLVAAVALTGNASVDDVRMALATRLPEYMVPTKFVVLDRFPRLGNGKIDLKALGLKVESIIDAEMSQRPPMVADRGQDAVDQEIHQLWIRYTGDDSVNPTKSFFDHGADSLDAIQLIAELQIKGYHVTAHRFLAEPTLQGLLKNIETGIKMEPASCDTQAHMESRLLTAAQAAFVSQCHAAPDHFNQAILLEFGKAIDPDAMRQAIADVVQIHPSLRTSYIVAEDGVTVQTQALNDKELMEVAFINPDGEVGVVKRRVQSASELLQKSLSLRNGKTFATKLFKLNNSGDLMLLVAHHLAVDLVSWKTLVSDITRCYSDRVEGKVPNMASVGTGFMDWVAHIDTHSDAIRRADADWLHRTQLSLQNHPVRIDPSNFEGNARTGWLWIAEHATARLAAELPERIGVPLHQAVLATFAYVLARMWQKEEIAVDLESHGRLTVTEDVDISRAVGWHTSTFPVVLSVDSQDYLATVAAVRDTMRSIPHLGIAYGLAEQATRKPGEAWLPSASICFNYLGEIQFPHDIRLPVKPAMLNIGSARHELNHRGHDLKLTVRILEGSMVADLSFPGGWAKEEMLQIVDRLGKELLGLVGIKATQEVKRTLIEDFPRNGLLTYAPPELFKTQGTHCRNYHKVLLTGATGYVGIHVLHELLVQSDAAVVCLVRPKNGQVGLERLEAVFSSYFPGFDMSLLESRVTVLNGDVSHNQLGQDDRNYQQLAQEIDAIYHFAADTKLFGQEEKFRRHNIVGVEQCISLAQTTRWKDLHYMSTLAVCGVNRKGYVVEFSEESSDVGQEFLNHYESTKYAAEQRVNAFRQAGGQGFIYRAGNVSGHSKTGRFQANASENRLVQFLSACVKCGKLPRDCGEPIVLSPVDEVAEGIVAISLDALTPAGVFHVDSAHEISIEKIFDAMRNCGIALERSEHASFSHLFRGVTDINDPDLALGYFWATRKPRNIKFNHAYTHDVLHRLGCSFSKPDALWIQQFVMSLVDQGAIKVPTNHPINARTRYTHPQLNPYRNPGSAARVVSTIVNS